jgi:hypothetical protein
MTSASEDTRQLTWLDIHVCGQINKNTRCRYLRHMTGFPIGMGRKTSLTSLCKANDTNMRHVRAKLSTRF